MNPLFVLDVVLSFCSLFCIKVVVVFCPLVLLCWACACFFVLGLALSLWILGYCSGGLFVLPFCSLIVFLLRFGFGRWFVIRSLWMVLFFVPWWLSLCLNSFFVLDVVLSCCPSFCMKAASVVCSVGLLVWACAFSLLLILLFVQNYILEFCFNCFILELIFGFGCLIWSLWMRLCCGSWRFP